MKRFLLGLAGTLLLAAGVGLTAERPNIVFILADDLGWADLGCYGSTFYQTPHLDRLAREGIRCTDAYAACNVCSPTRASIMTGKYPARLNLTDWLPGRRDRPDQKLKRPVIRQELPLKEFTVAEAFQAAGYQTAFIGKWHLGGPDYYPEHQGFELNIAGCELGHPPSYFSPYHIPTLPDGPKGEYLNDRLTEEALKFLERASQQPRPFFLYFAEYAVHTPLQAKTNRIDFYRAKAAQLARPNGPEFIIDNGHRVRQIQNHAVYAAMVESLDESVGRVLSKLETLGLATNTIVVFTSDNGGLSTAEGWPTSNLPLRGGKGWPYEGGIREPLLVRWPASLPSGTVCHEPLISTDYYPTLLELAGLPLRPEQHLDGLSMAQVLKGHRRAPRPLFWHYPHYSNQGGGPEGAVRSGDWKLIEWFEDNRVELFNLADDLGERHNLADQNPKQREELLALLKSWRRSVDAKMPSPNPDYSAAPRTREGAPRQKPEASKS